MPLIGHRLIRRDRVVSTMDEVAALAAAGEPEGTVVLAEEQTGGRGRAGRRWEAPAGTAVLCSVLLRPGLPPDRLGPLPLMVGVAVAEAVEAVARLRCQLKWPNDVWLGERKVAGVLIAARAGAVIVGIGINVDGPVSALPAGATTVAAAAGRPIARAALVERLLARLDAGYLVFTAARGAPDLGPWRARAAMLGEAVTIESGATRRHGRFVGVAADGALELAAGDGSVTRIHAGDLVRGPVLTAAGPARG